MYGLAGTLDPERYHELATAAFTEMLCAGWTAVGEFHYLPGLADAVRAAADRVGIRLVLLETLYLTGGIGRDPDPVQQRFAAGGFDGWAARVARRADPATAPRCTRSGPFRRTRCDGCARSSGRGRCTCTSPSSRPRTTPAAPRTGAPRASCCPTPVCSARPAPPCTPPTSIRPTSARWPPPAPGSASARPPRPTWPTGSGRPGSWSDAGCRLSLGSDQHAVVDPFAEARGLEYGERLRTGQRGRFDPAELVAALGRGGHRALGLAGGALAVGAPCDLVAVRRDSARTAGADPAQLVLAASAADVHTVVVHGRVLVRDGVHVELGDPGPLLAAAIDGRG